MSGIPAAIEADFAHGRRLEWWTLAWMSSIIAVMYFTMGASKAMQSALIEDFLSLVPAITFLVAGHFEPTKALLDFAPAKFDWILIPILLVLKRTAQFGA